ncbi:plasma membrane ascorbate-dependent reductase CYBRD1-like isoform X2 [Apostichopus japonicus]|uniref:plasma membrane ascorbate-dependent reductase CYBRD1-like isoform X2 n=1 Tax=Stichopus japonicus TaxID=307972 RepID=UPI003AB8C060
MPSSSSFTFWSLIVGSQVCGLSAYILLQSWLHIYNDGFDWNSDVSHLIQNYHALFMTLGFLLLFGEATLAYRLLARSRASYLLQKSVHATILITATIIWVVGLTAAFKARNLDKTHGKEVKHFYSFHSWIGLLLLVIFLCQLCFAIAWYAHARLISPTLQATYQSVHVFNGLFLFTLSAATCFTGLNELGIYKAENYRLLSSSGIHLNFVGIAMLGFATTIGYLLWKPEFKLTPPVGSAATIDSVDHVENNL